MLLRRSVWDGAGFQPRSSSVRFAGGVPLILFRLFALTSDRSAVWCDSRWIVSGLLTRQLFLGVAQWWGTRFGSETTQVRILSPRRSRVHLVAVVPTERADEMRALSALSSTAECLADNRVMEVRFLQGGL